MDSRLVLRAENCKSNQGEIWVQEIIERIPGGMGSLEKCLSEAAVKVSERSITLGQPKLCIVNNVYGSPLSNEPRAMIDFPDSYSPAGTVCIYLDGETNDWVLALYKSMK